MAIDTRFRLSRLQPLAQYLLQGTDIDSGLADILEAELPPKEADRLVRLLDKLLLEPRGAEVLLLTMSYLLDEWIAESSGAIHRINQNLEPFPWLASSDHLEVVQTFRRLL